MPYIKTTGEMNEEEYNDFMNKVKEALGKCQYLTEMNGEFFAEVYPSDYRDKISEERMNELFEKFSEQEGYENFTDFVENQLYEDYDNYYYDRAVEIFDEMSKHLDKETQLCLDVSLSLGEIFSETEFMVEAGYGGLSIDVKDFLEGEYHLNLPTKSFDTKALSESELGEETFKEALDTYKKEGLTKDTLMICATVDKNDVLDVIDNIAKGKGFVEVEGGKIICQELDFDVEIDGKFNLPADKVDTDDFSVKYDYLEEYYGEARRGIEDREKFHSAIEEAVRAVNLGSLELPITFDYSDMYDESRIALMYDDWESSSCSKTKSFNEYYVERAEESLVKEVSDLIAGLEEEAKDYLEENNPEAYEFLEKNGLAIRDEVDIVPVYDVYELVPECRMDIMVATPAEMKFGNNSIEMLSAFVKEGELPSEEFKEFLLDNGLVDMVHQLGYKPEDIIFPTNEYMEEIKESLENLEKDNSNHLAVTFLVEVSGKEAIDMLDFGAGRKAPEDNIVISAGTNVYLHDESNEKAFEFTPVRNDLTISQDKIYKIMPEGESYPHNRPVGDVVRNISKSEWNGEAQFTSMTPEPELSPNAYEHFIETVNERKAEEQAKAEMFREALIEAVKAVNYGSMEVELYFDYRDKYDEGQIAEMYNDYCHALVDGKIKDTSFSDYYCEQTYDSLVDMEANTVAEALKQATDYLEENNPEAYRYMVENEIDDNLYMYAIEHTDICAKYDVYELVPECRLDIMIATREELNIENSAIELLAETIESGKIPKEYEDCVLGNGLVYLLNQQGHKAEELINPADDYMKKVKEALESQCLSNMETTILVSAEGKELLDILSLKTTVIDREFNQSDEKNIEIEAGASVYLHNEFAGDTADFVPTEKPIVIPELMIAEIKVEGGRQRSYDYTVDDVCVLAHSEWDSEVKMTDKDFIPMQSNDEKFFEAVRENHKKLENEQEGFDLD